VDLFAGSGVVATFVAKRHKVPVLAADLQSYSKVFSAAVIERTEPIDAHDVWNRWCEAATQQFDKRSGIPDTTKITRATVLLARDWCGRRRDWPLTRAYGGHYYSPTQALLLDSLRSTLPKRNPYRTVALAALIEAASYCAAAPGHTAQPFQPTRSAKPFITETWGRSVRSRVEAVFKALCSEYAKVQGQAVIADAMDISKNLHSRDLVFVDPPYSAVQYSRFYHVLEALATGAFHAVSGAGRYPPESLRPKSDFSLVSRSRGALVELLDQLAACGTHAVITFPDHDCSNGLSGALVAKSASRYFRVQRKVVFSRFSTLGGTSGPGQTVAERAARHAAKELILYLRPKARRARRSGT
jgi:adenine-specific DNA-methyltransferase